MRVHMAFGVSRTRSGERYSTADALTAGEVIIEHGYGSSRSEPPTARPPGILRAVSCYPGSGAGEFGRRISDIRERAARYSGKSCLRSWNRKPRIRGAASLFRQRHMPFPRRRRYRAAQPRPAHGSPPALFRFPNSHSPDHENENASGI